MCVGGKNNYAEGGSVAPSRARAYTSARKAEVPQKGMTYPELLVDNIVGLDNEYLSFGEKFGQAFDEDELGTLKNMAIGAYEGAKKAVTEPITTAEEFFSGINKSVSNLANEDLDARLTRMFGVGYQDATGEQVNKAREAVIGDALTAAEMIPATFAIKKGVDVVEGAARRAMTPPEPSPGGIVTLAEPPQERQWRPEDGIPDPFRNVGPAPGVPQQLQPSLERRNAVGRNTMQAANNPPQEAFFELTPEREALASRIGGLLDRAYTRDPLTAEEAFDVMTYERYGPLAVEDPDVTFDDWAAATDLDEEGARRIHFLTDPNAGTEGANPLPRAGDRQGDNLDPLDPFGGYDPADFYADGYDGYDGEDAQELLENDPDNPAYWDLPDDDVIEDMNAGMMRGGRPLPEPRPSIPITQKAEGIASLYSPSRKAVDLLDRPSYDDLDALRVSLGNRGGKPDEMERIVSRLRGETGPISKERIAQAADEQAAGISVARVTKGSAYNSDERYYMEPRFFLPGADNLEANVFEMQLDSEDFPIQAEKHFKRSVTGKAPLFHTRTGMMRSEPWMEPDVYHLGEIQSDWAQLRQKLFKTEDEADEAFEQLENLKKSEFFEPAAEEKLRDKIYFHALHGTRGDFDANFPAPYMGTTDKWVQLGLRQSLIDAVNSGSKRLTMATGDQAFGYTGGKLEGQRKFYDDVVPKNMNEVLRKFAKEAGIPQPKITRTKVYGKGGEAFEVPAVEFTDEFIEAIKRIGLPSFAKGGIVPGSLLDVDIFEPIPLY